MTYADVMELIEAHPECPEGIELFEVCYVPHNPWVNLSPVTIDANTPFVETYPIDSRISIDRSGNHRLHIGWFDDAMKLFVWKGDWCP